jgi:hypothetical protein
VNALKTLHGSYAIAVFLSTNTCGPYPFLAIYFAMFVSTLSKLVASLYSPHVWIYTGFSI